MCYVLRIPQPLHQPVKHRCRLSQPEIKGRTCVAKSKAWYARCNNVERLLRAHTETRQRLRIRKRADNPLHFDERRGPRVAYKQWYGIGMFRALVDEVDAERVRC